MASANILQSYLIKLGVSVDKRGLKGFVGTVTKALSGMAKMGAVAVGAFGVVQAGVTKLASSEAELNYLSRRLDMTVESIERLGYVASQSDSSAQAMQSSLEGLRRTAGNAASGMARAQRVFEDLNVGVTDANGNIKGTEQLFKDVGAALAGMDRGQQASILQRLGMDKTVLRTLIENTQDLQEEFDKMAQASGVDFKRTAEAGNELMDELGKMGDFVRLTTKSLGTGLMEEFRDSIRSGRKWIVENIDLVKGAVDGAIKVIKIGASISGRAIKRLGQVFVWLHEKTSGLSTVLIGLAAIMTLISSPVLLVAGLLTGLFLIIDDLWTALEGGESYFDWSPWIDSIRSVLKWLEDLGGYIKSEAVAAFKDLIEWCDRLAAALGIERGKEGISEAKSGVLEFLGVLKDLAVYIGGSAWEVVKGTFGFIGDTIILVISILRDLSKVVVDVFRGDFTSAFEGMKGILKSFDEFGGKVFGRIKGLLKGVIGGIFDAADRLRELLGLSEKKSGEDDVQSDEEILESQGLTPTHVKQAARRDHEQAINYADIPEETAQRMASLRLRPDENMLRVPPPLPSHVNPLMLGQANNPETVNNNSSGDVNQTNYFTINAPSDHGREIAEAMDLPMRKATQDMARQYPRR